MREQAGTGCVEVPLLPAGQVALRDTKDRTRPPHIYAAPRWSDLLAAIRGGELTDP